MISYIPLPTLQHLKHQHSSQLWKSDSRLGMTVHSPLIKVLVWERLRQPKLLTVCSSQYLMVPAQSNYSKTSTVHTCISHSLGMSLSRIKFICLKCNHRVGEASSSRTDKERTSTWIQQTCWIFISCNSILLVNIKYLCIFILESAVVYFW